LQYVWTQRIDLVRTAGSLSYQHFINAAKPKVRQPIDLAQTRQMSVIPPSPEVSNQAQVEPRDVIHSDADYVPKVHELTRAARKESSASEGAVVTALSQRTIIQSEKLPITATTGLDLVAIHDDLNRIYGKQDDAGPVIPIE